MQIKYLELKQLLTLQPGSLKGRFKDNYNHKVKDAAYIIQAAVLVMVRNFFSIDNFSYMARDFIRELFLDHSAELVSVRHLCIYFEAYFNEEEWAGIIDSLFTDHAEYLQVTANARLHTEHILPMLHAGSCTVETPKNLALTFFDAAGKKHRCTIKNVHRSYTTQENCAALSILGMLTIFEKDGVRRFTRLAKSRFITPEDDYDCANEEVPVELAVEPQVKKVTPQANETSKPAKGSKLSVFLDDPRPLPEHISRLKNFKGETYGDYKKYLLEGIDLDTISKEELTNRMLTAAYKKVQVKDVPAEDYLDELSDEEIDELPGKWLFNLEEEPLQPENDSELDDTEDDDFDLEEARLEEIRRQRQEKQEKQRIDKALRKTGKGGRKGKKGKNGNKKRK